MVGVSRNDATADTTTDFVATDTNNLDQLSTPPASQESPAETPEYPEDKGGISPATTEAAAESEPIADEQNAGSPSNTADETTTTSTSTPENSSNNADSSETTSPAPRAEKEQASAEPSPAAPPQPGAMFASNHVNINRLPSPQFKDPGVYAFKRGSVTLVARTTVVNNLILTSASAIGGHEALAMKVDDRWFSVVVIGVDPANDLAILSVPTKQFANFVDKYGTQLKPVRRDDIAAEGEYIKVIEQVDGYTEVEVGMILAKDQATTTINQMGVYDTIATSAHKLDVSAGAPVRRSTRVVGMVVGTNDYLVTVVPIVRVLEAANNLIEFGTPAAEWIGVQASTQPDGKVVVSDVVANGPADDAGILKGDVIKAISGVPVIDSSHLAHLIRQTNPGEVIDVQVVRAKRNLVLEVTIGLAH